jgi:ABC-2 type transport system permease protein
VGIPGILLILFSSLPLLNLGPGKRVDFLAPGIIALAVMATAFTGQAIAAGFERRYGVLKRLGATPLGRSGLVLARTLTVLGIELGQLALLALIALALGWSPHGSPAPVLLLLLLGTAAFSGLGLLMAGTLRAETTLAAANLLFILLLLGGGVLVPLARFPGGLRGALGLLPISALAEGLRSVLAGGALPLSDLAILAGWAVASILAAAAWFRWE